MKSLNAGKASVLALVAALVVSSIMLGKSFKTVFANGNGNSGSIWTTLDNCGTPQQDINHYSNGDTVYINGSGFDADTYSWTIKGQPGKASEDPGQTVASGNVIVDQSGAFCFGAYVVGSDDGTDDGEYDVKVGNKGDNYGVNGTAGPNDVCSNIAGVQETVPAGDYQVNGACYPKTPVCADNSYENYGGDDGIFDQTTEVADNSLCSNTPPIDVCPNIGGNQATLPDGYHFETINDVRIMCIQDPTPTPVDICANIDGVQTGVPDGLHLDASGANCVAFSQSNPPENTSSAPQGQVLGASTMAGTGSFEENLYMAIMGLGGVLTAFGFTNFKKSI